MVSSYLSYLLTGVLLAFVSYPVYERLVGRFSSVISAFLVVSLTVFAFILPFTIVIGAIGGDAAALVSNLNADSSMALEEFDSLVKEYLGEDFDVEQRIRGFLGDVASFLPSGLSSAISVISSVSIGLSLMLFLQFYALKDGERLVDWSLEFKFMSKDRQQALYRSTANSVWEVVKGHVSIAVAQGLIAGVGLFVAGVPNVVFWTFMMIILGFIPVIGSAIIWIPASIYLGLKGEPYMALFLLVYSVIVVGATDNLLRPLVVDEDSGIHPFFILLGLIGGVGIFGPVGLFLGPVLFGILKNLLNMIKDKQKTN
jgi:predicted PurR-regulated permease PerM